MSTDTKLTLDDYMMTLIRLKARQLVGRYGFTASDREDIEQDLTLDLLTRLDRYDPAKGRPATYVRMVVDRCTVTLIRKRTAQSRDYRRAACSLDELGDGDFVEPVIDDESQRDLQIDLQDALDKLPEDLSAVAADLRTGTLADAARKHGCSREAVRRQARRIRECLGECGLGDYAADNQV